MDQVYIGIDVSKNTLDVASYSTRERWQFPNHDTGINQLVELIRKQPPALVVAKAAGGCETAASLCLKESRGPVCGSKPQRSQGFCQSYQKAGHDRYD